LARSCALALKRNYEPVIIICAHLLMTLSANQLKTEIIYPSSDGKPMADSDPARDYLIYAVDALDIYFQDRNDVYVSVDEARRLI
jgi:hypothetical protein